MSLFEQLVQAVEEARGMATRAANEEQAWAGRFCEQLTAYLNAPQEAVHYVSEEGGVMVHVGFPSLRDVDGWHAFQLEIATDSQQHHRFLLNLLFQPTEEEHRVKLGSEGEVFRIPLQREDFFDRVFVSLLADLKTPEGQDTARKGGVRKIGSVSNSEKES